MSRGAVDALFPLLLKEWKDSWVQATNAPGELKCQVERAWGEAAAGGPTPSAVAALFDSVTGVPAQRLGGPPPRAATPA